MLALIALCNAFWMIIYLYGLDITSPESYSAGLYIFPFILITIAIVSFYKKNTNNK